MPHCIIEYSLELKEEVEPSRLISSVHTGALKSQLFPESDIKVRAFAFEHFSTGSTGQDFVHVTAKILSGRNLEQRNKLSQSILHELDKVFSGSVSLTVEIVEIEKESYAKLVR